MEQTKLSQDYPASPAEPQKMPRQTFWPAGLAFGVLLLFWGLLTSFIVSLAGLLLTTVSVAGWIQDLNHE